MKEQDTTYTQIKYVLGTLGYGQLTVYYLICLVLEIQVSKGINLNVQFGKRTMLIILQFGEQAFIRESVQDSL